MPKKKLKFLSLTLGTRSQQALRDPLLTFARILLMSPLTGEADGLVHRMK